MTICYPEGTDWSCLFTDAELTELRNDPAQAHMLEVSEAYAWSLLASLTAYRIATCPITVRPCLARCGPPEGMLAFPVGGGHTGALGTRSGSFNPHITGGSWVNSCGCQPSDCSCTALSEVILPGPVGGIDSVVIDGVTLPSSAYRIDNGNRLVRQDGGEWPSCQDQSVATVAPPTFEPATITWADGSVAIFTREGDVVTVTATPATTPDGSFQSVPEQFRPGGGSTIGLSPDSDAYMLNIGSSAYFRRFFEGNETGTWMYLADPVAPVAQERTFTVSYYRGSAPNIMTRNAAGLLAAEFYAACSGGDCKLPDNVVSVSMQGTDYELTPADFPEGITGLKAVDALIRIYNPYKRKAPTRIASPDAPMTRTPTWRR